MKALKIGWIICLSVYCLNGEAQIKQVGATTFEQGLSDDVQLLDVRTPEEFNQGHLKDAMLADWKEKEEFERRTEAIDKDKPVFVYCLSGGRSLEAAEYLNNKGFEVLELKGGINAWKQAGKAVQGAKKVAQISEDSYVAMLQSAEYVLVNFGASWCPPCRKMEPVLDALQQEYSELPVIDIDAGTQTALMKLHEVVEMPTYILYKNGNEIWRTSGMTELNEFAEALQ